MAKSSVKKQDRTDVKRSDRYFKNRMIRVEALRENLNLNIYKGRLHTIDLELHEISESLKRGILMDQNGEILLTKKDFDGADEVTFLPSMTEANERLVKTRISALKESANINFKLLNKCLPDARHIDSDSEKERDPSKQFALAIKLATEGLDDELNEE